MLHEYIYIYIGFRGVVVWWIEVIRFTGFGLSASGLGAYRYGFFEAAVSGERGLQEGAVGLSGLRLSPGFRRLYCRLGVVSLSESEGSLLGSSTLHPEPLLFFLLVLVSSPVKIMVFVIMTVGADIYSSSPNVET